MYKLASATRGDRALIDNTGPWLTETPGPTPGGTQRTANLLGIEPLTI